MDGVPRPSGCSLARSCSRGFAVFLTFQMGLETFQFTKLRFGFSIAHGMFTMPLGNRLANMGVATLMYLDTSSHQVRCSSQCPDISGGVDGHGVPHEHSQFAIIPTQNLLWLGMEWCTEDPNGMPLLFYWGLSNTDI